LRIKIVNSNKKLEIIIQHEKIKRLNYSSELRAYLRAAVTALEASEMECLARSAGSWRRTAVWTSAARMVDFLLGQGVDMNKPNGAGLTPLQCATKNKQAGTIDMLKSKGAK